MDDTPWIVFFLQHPKGRFFVQIESNFLETQREYARNSYDFHHFDEAFSLLFKTKGEVDKFDKKIVNETTIIYGMIHAQYLMTESGQSKMIQKFQQHEFPECPRVLCHHFTCFPTGQSAIFGEHRMKLFCPNCSDFYLQVNDNPTNIDGAFFGPYWIHSLLENHPEIIPDTIPSSYVPRIFGFRVYNPNSESVNNHKD